MKKQIATLSLIALAIGMCQSPAQAFLNVSLFNRHDINHDGRWDRREWYGANDYYFRHHPGVMVVDHRGLGSDFTRLDVNHDGYLGVDEVRTYRDW